MKILVYGAGVIGCELAHMLCKSQNDVTLLARGKWKKIIEEKGLIIRHYAQLHTTIDRIKIVEVLKPEDVYDIIFVVMQYSQLQAVLPTLAANKSKYIVLVGNNMNAEECQKQLTEASPVIKEIAFGFQGTGGRREGNRVISIHAGIGMTVGGLKDKLPSDFQTQLIKAFSNTGYHLTYEEDMDAWLKCHMAFILPICYVCYALSGRLPRADKSQINQIIDAACEAHAVLKKLGYRIRPDGEEEYFTIGRRKCYWMLRIMAKTPLGRLAASDHAMHAVAEMRALDDAFELLRSHVQNRMPVWDSLRKEAFSSENQGRK